MLLSECRKKALTGRSRLLSAYSKPDIGERELTGSFISGTTSNRAPAKGWESSAATARFMEVQMHARLRGQPALNAASMTSRNSYSSNGFAK